MPTPTSAQDEKIDQKLVLDAFRTLLEIAQFSRTKAKDGELKIFYAHLTAYYAMIYGQAGGLGKNTGDSKNLLWRISADIESIMALDFLKGISGLARRLQGQHPIRTGR